MEPSVLAGDYIIVNKLAYGARIVKNFNFMQGGKFETFRVKGFGKVKRNDVLVFKSLSNNSGKTFCFARK
jgi:signal peptidase I